ncbi:hypothetical protein [Clostridioides sp. ZZV14-6345]|uniref:hypothetical protein n=1 Tax=Clostridioides sp. ZZV14-6345 TaxID=2811496 RepID=UPI001D10D972|nr:hypothetical protein [Clostridioides sp. ZZV14-6345]
MNVEELEKTLRNYPKDTIIHVSCGNCNHGSINGDNLIKLKDATNQTFGYIELNINNNSTPNIELSKDKEGFYKKEISRLNEEIQNNKKDLNMYKRTVENIEKILKTKEFYRF